MPKGIAGSTQPCIAPDCDRPGNKGYGYCNKHYQRWKKWGDPTVVEKGGHKITGIDLFWRRVNKDGPVPDYAPHLGPCWIWTNRLTRDGYGHFTLNGKTRMAHSIAYEQLIGPIPGGGLVPDHLCRVRNCCNPWHLEWVTDRENVLRGIAPPAQNATKTHCIRGHEFTPENTYVSRNGSRHCKTCALILKARRRVAAESLSHPPRPLD